MRNLENRNRWFRDYYRKHKQQYVEKASEWKRQQEQWFFDTYGDILVCPCGEKDIDCLDFHHRNPDEKEGSVRQMIRTCSRKKVVSEIAKCDVLCSNCHRKLHARLRRNLFTTGIENATVDR